MLVLLFFTFCALASTEPSPKGIGEMRGVGSGLNKLNALVFGEKLYKESKHLDKPGQHIIRRFEEETPYSKVKFNYKALPSPKALDLSEDLLSVLRADTSKIDVKCQEDSLTITFEGTGREVKDLMKTLPGKKLSGGLTYWCQDGNGEIVPFYREVVSVTEIEAVRPVRRVLVMTKKLQWYQMFDDIDLDFETLPRAFKKENENKNNGKRVDIIEFNLTPNFLEAEVRAEQYSEDGLIFDSGIYARANVGLKFLFRLSITSLIPFKWDYEFISGATYLAYAQMNPTLTAIRSFEKEKALYDKWSLPKIMMIGNLPVVYQTGLEISWSLEVVSPSITLDMGKISIGNNAISNVRGVRCTRSGCNDYAYTPPNFNIPAIEGPGGLSWSSTFSARATLLVKPRVKVYGFFVMYVALAPYIEYSFDISDYVFRGSYGADLLIGFDEVALEIKTAVKQMKLILLKPRALEIPLFSADFPTYACSICNTAVSQLFLADPNCPQSCIFCTSSGCTTCQPGTQKNAAGACVACPDGRWGTDCSAECTAGFYCFQKTRNQCPEGYYCPAGSAQALACPSGTWSTAGSSICSVVCPAGYWCAEGRKARCRTQCEAQQYLSSSCPQGSLNDTTTCTFCEEDTAKCSKRTSICTTGPYYHCQVCRQGYKAEAATGLCLPISVSDCTAFDYTTGACTCKSGYRPGPLSGSSSCIVDKVGMATSQSSTHENLSYFMPNMANDGAIGTYAHTGWSTSAWWSATFQPTKVHKVIVYNLDRDGSRQRMSGFNVRLFSDTTKSTLLSSKYFTGIQAIYTWVLATPVSNVRAVEVRLDHAEYLILVDVEVFAVQCDNNCLHCDANYCTACLSGYYLSAGQCLACQISNCQPNNCFATAATRTCLTCNPGYYRYIPTTGDDECRACSPISNCAQSTCEEGDSNKQCTTCLSGYYLVSTNPVNSQCLSCTSDPKCVTEIIVNSQKVCTTGPYYDCSVCNINYHLENGACKPLSAAACASVNSATNTCNSCSASTRLGPLISTTSRACVLKRITLTSKPLASSVYQNNPLWDTEKTVDDVLDSGMFHTNLEMGWWSATFINPQTIYKIVVTNRADGSLQRLNGFFIICFSDAAGTIEVARTLMTGTQSTYTWSLGSTPITCKRVHMALDHVDYFHFRQAEFFVSQCPNNCLSCDINTQECTACYPGYYRSGTTCVACTGGSEWTCPSTSYRSGSACTGYTTSDTQSCVGCSLDPSSCVSGEYFSNPCTGTTYSPPVCASCWGTTCGSCKDGSADTCMSCKTNATELNYGYCCSDRNCMECLGDGSGCTKCTPGYFLSNGVCTACATGCANCNSISATTCTSCLTGYYLSASGTCITCPPTCRSCDSSTRCYSCVDGYYESGLTCYACTSIQNCNGTTTCSSNDSLQCSECKKGYYLVNGAVDTCLPCGENCEKCTTGEKSSCLECAAGYYLNTTNINNQQASDLITPNNCIACNPGFFSSANSTQCTACPAGQTSSPGSSYCFTCTPIANCGQTICNEKLNKICTSCSSGFLVSVPGYDDACMPNQLCAAGFFLDGGSCVACSTSPSRCSDCATGTYSLLPRNQPCASCAPGCPPGKYASSVCTPTSNNVCHDCLKCPIGFYNPACPNIPSPPCPVGFWNYGGLCALDVSTETATQSSTSTNLFASLAVDKSSTTFSSTVPELSKWWAISFSKPYGISRVTVVNRDSAQQSIVPFYVELYSDNAFKTLVARSTTFNDALASYTFSFSVPELIRSVKLVSVSPNTSLHPAEIVFFGTNPCVACPQNTYSLYGSATCLPCAIPNCISTTCTSLSDMKCTTCASGFYKKTVNGVDSCIACTADPNCHTSNTFCTTGPYFGCTYCKRNFNLVNSACQWYNGSQCASTDNASNSCVCDSASAVGPVFQTESWAGCSLRYASTTMSVAQISIHDGNTAWFGPLNAVDRNSGNHIHTGWDAAPWWRQSFPTQRVYKVVISNNHGTDTATLNRMNGFYMRLYSDSSFTTLAIQYRFTGVQSQYIWNSGANPVSVGSIQIQLDHGDYLIIREVELFVDQCASGCAKCSSYTSCTSCATGNYLLNAAQCVGCTGGFEWACPSGYYRTGSACLGSGTSNTQQCTVCSECLPGFFKTANCTLTTDTVCAPCPTGSFLNSLTNKCEACSICAIGQYESASCTTTANRVCTACPTCPANYFSTSCPSAPIPTGTSCPTGYWLYDGQCALSLSPFSTATQSTTNYIFYASNSIDQDLATFGHTSLTSTSGNWWAVSFQKPVWATKIVIVNRVDSCCKTRLPPFRVELYSDSAFTTSIMTSPRYTETQDTYTFALSQPTLVNSLKVLHEQTEALHLGEVVVFGTTPCVACPAGTFSPAGSVYCK